MKKWGFLSVAVALWAMMAWGQYGYQYMSGGYWFGAQFIGQEGWMVGGTGQVLHTVDGGRTWVLQPLPECPSYPTFNNLLDLDGICFVDRLHGWVCPGEYSPYLWRTRDGGTAWEPESVGKKGECIYPAKIAFADTLNGWLVDGWVKSRIPIESSGRIFATTNGGQSWTRQDSSRAWYGVQALTSRQCWAVGYGGQTGRTTDGGATWLIQDIAPFKTLYGIAFTDTLYGWACGDSGTIARTMDGGMTWTLQTSGTMRELLAITFIDSSRGFTVGDSGTLLRTTNGGRIWAPIATGLSASLAALSFGDSLHGWAIGEGGTILETSDGGQTWRVTRKGMTDRLQAVSFVDDQTGRASSWEGNIWATQDGGKNWSKQFSVSPKRLRGLAMANALRGWAVGDSGLILVTQNGGVTWTPQGSGTQRNLWNVFEGDAQHAWACGAGRTIAQTTNGGGTWKTFSVAWPDSGITGFASADTLWGWALFKDGNVWATTNSGRSWASRGRIGSMGWRHLSFVDPFWGWAVGDSGIVRSTDGGRSWQSQSAYRLLDVAGVTRMKAWAVGDSGRIIVTTDGGITWAPQASPIAESLFSVSFADTLHGIVGADWSYILVTRNGGVVWDTVRQMAWKNWDVFLVDSLVGWTAGGCQTSDGGYTWQYKGGGFGVAVHFANRDTGWIAGRENEIRRTTDGGATWDTVITGSWGLKDIRLATGRIGWCGIWDTRPPYYIRSKLIETFDRGNGSVWSAISDGRVKAMGFKSGGTLTSSSTCFVGEGNLTLRTYSDLSWDISPMFADTLFWVYPFILVHWGFSSGDGRTGWAVGQWGACTVTTDGGLSWGLQKRRIYDQESLLVAVKAFDGQTARATGYLGNSLWTTDGGLTWVEDPRGTQEWLLGSSFLTPTLGWVAGENGMVLKYGRLPSGVEEEQGKSALPLRIRLWQNRPNPFEGRTEIRYQLAGRGKVTLTVFNVLGQAVRRVVDQNQEPGAYAVIWDGRDEVGRPATSGVYFYRLEAAGKSQTRKMVKVR